MAQYRLQVNGRAAAVESWDPAQPLLYVLRNALGLHGPKFGCGLGQCGACTVLIDGTPARSCITSVEQAAGHTITTLEGLGTPAQPDPVQAAFIAEQAAQCGYCTNGMIMAAKALLNQTPRPTPEQVKQGLDGYLCRCGTHTRILHAVLRAAKA
ncbi:MAG TPA: (2Fe-2S)-binding protein [Candidatus Dormibacteraeota bacterium]|nr:(2Fe-2S)-binding protein [Candidatus Dormibacteraeota bacterium]